MTLGEAIQAHRYRRGLTQEKLGKRLDVSTATVHGWEAGKKRPKAPNVPPLAKELGISSTKLFGLIRDRETSEGSQ